MRFCAFFATARAAHQLLQECHAMNQDARAICFWAWMRSPGSVRACLDCWGRFAEFVSHSRPPQGHGRRQLVLLASNVMHAKAFRIRKEKLEIL